MRRFFHILLFAATLLLPVTIEAQSGKYSHLFIEPAFRYGRIIPTRPVYNYLFDADIISTELRIGYQTCGNHAWEEWFRFPSFGVALRYSYYNHNIIGDEYALFGFMNGHFVHRKNFSFFYQIGAGLNGWSKTYNFYTNPENIFVGSHLCAYLDFCLGLTARMSPHTDLVVRADFSHSSNGVLRLPNEGVNSISLSAGVRCRLHDGWEAQHRLDTVSTFRPINSLYFSVSPAVKQSRAAFTLSEDRKPTYCFATTLEVGYLRQPHPKFRYGAGFDLFYNSEVLTRLPESERRQSKCFMPAAFAQFDVIYGRLILHTAIGGYLFRYYDFYKPYYERAGLQCLLGRNRNHIVGVCIKAHLGRADYIEWTYGYQFLNWNDKKDKVLKSKRFLKSEI